MTVYCPADTRAIVQRDRISNFALWYQYYLENSTDATGKVKFSLEAATLRDSQQLLEPLRERQKRQLEYFAQSHDVYTGFFTLDWRMIIGLGAEHVQETNLSLHHVYGIPMIPASGIKGVVRGWVTDEHFEGQAAALEDQTFVRVFGTQEQAGEVIFLPAYPSGNSVRLAVDIMNPHFPAYYTGSSLPTDDQNPIPIHFLTVSEASFRFALVCKKNNQPLLERVGSWLEAALRQRGLGAKTAVGYGAFSSQRNVPRALRPRADFEAPLRRRAPRPQPLSLEAAYAQFEASPERLDPGLIDLRPLQAGLAPFAVIAARDDICEQEAVGGIERIPPMLIEAEEDLVMVSDFGRWVWTTCKARLLAARIVRLPRLVYSTPFRQYLKKRPPAELSHVQEQLIAWSNQLALVDGDVDALAEALPFRYTAHNGIVTIWALHT